MKPTILCVDDERLVLVSLKEQLGRYFGSAVRVETAENGLEALELVDELLECGELIPLVISDHLMPGIKGDELLARVHELLPDTLKIMLTGEASAAAVGAAVNSASLYRFIGKPWGHDDLMLTVREALARYDMTRRLEGQARLLAEMHEVALDLTASLAVSDRHTRLVASTMRVFPAEAVYLHRLSRNRLELLGSTNSTAHRTVDAALYPELLSEKVATRLKGPAAREAELIYAREASAHDAHIRVPLLSDDGPIGLVSMFASARDAFQDVSDDRIVGFSALVAASVQTTKLVDQIEELSEQRRAVAQHLHRAAAKSIAGPLHGKGEAVTKLRAQLEAAAQADDPVLLVGRPGAGCEVSARAIHDRSLRSDGPFITLRCAGSDDAESVFSGGPDATLQLAAGGTLFFDRLDRLSRAAQRKLADFIATGADVRVIASVGSEIGPMISQGTFDGELGRKFENEIEVPTLRQRADDISVLAEFYIRQHAGRLGKRARRLTEASLRVLEAYRWPGNIHELAIVMERGVMLAKGEQVEVDEAMLDGAGPLGSYRLIERIGRGGMGEVWRAKHQHLARPAAVKFIRTDATIDTKAIERFRREAEATARLRSPHTVELYDFGVSDDGAFYYVMELLEGLDLDGLVQEQGPLLPERVVMLMLQLCRSLSEAHEIGLVHRDIKPANLFVSRLGGEYDFLKVLDFGMVTSADPGKSDLTGSSVQGTPAYIAPEIVLQHDIDGRADIYCLGLVAYYLLTGSMVFKKATPIEMFMHHVKTEPTPLSAVTDRAIPAALEEIVMDCLKKEPSERPRTAEILAARLEAVHFDKPWTHERARSWWWQLLNPDTVEMPDVGFDDPRTKRVKALDE